MSWTLLLGVVLVLGLALLFAAARRAELARMAGAVRERETAERLGSGEAALLKPEVDLTRCLGCGTCVASCPEDGVLGLVHGQAMVVNAARCVGHAACERECPVGAITVTLPNSASRRDVPALTRELEAVGAPGLFLAGEVTARALIKTAVDQGASAGAEIARRVLGGERGEDGVLDLCVVGAGPAGLSCSLEAKRHGLRFVTLDQEKLPGGTVAKYPRRKLVTTQPVEMPVYGAFRRTVYEKEELVGLWQEIADEQELPIRGGETCRSVERNEDGTFTVRTDSGEVRARFVCLAIGRRGSPRKLGVPGEDLPKVAYALLDAHSYRGRRILVVGGGDTAAETALALSVQPGNRVTIAYRKERFFRARARTAERLDAAIAAKRIDALFGARVVAVRPGAVDLEADRGGAREALSIPNDDVFVMAGGEAPVDLLSRAGVSFDPSLRPAPKPFVEQGTGLFRALAIGFALSLAALVFALVQSDYYSLPRSERPAHPKHALLRPGLGLGLQFGIFAAAFIAANLVYLLRRAPRFRFTVGSLRSWMTLHVATGILAFLAATLHGAMEPRHTVGGHAFWALAVLLASGAIGRYFYAYVPRAANGRELALAETKERLRGIGSRWEGGDRRFREMARREVEALAFARQWRGSFAGRVMALAGWNRDLSRVLARLARDGRRFGVAPAEVRETLDLAREAHRSALMVAHYEDLRALLASWRYVHRWVAVLLVALVVLHVVSALTYGSFLAGEEAIP